MTIDTEAKSSGGKNIEFLLQEAIDQLTQSRKSKPVEEIETKSEDKFSSTANRGADEAEIITKLISQLESLKEDGLAKQSESSNKANEDEELQDSKKEKKNERAVCSSETRLAEEVAKELRDIKRQNTVTHWLLSGMIILTVVWQLSEGFIILKLRNGVNRPFRSLWNWFRGMARGPSTNGQSTYKQSSSIKDTLVESAALPLKLTNEISQMDFQLPQMQLPSLVSGNNE